MLLFRGIGSQPSVRYWPTPACSTGESRREAVIACLGIQGQFNQPFDTVMLVLLDEDFDAYAIYEASREAVTELITRPGSKARNGRGSVGISQFKAIAQARWTRPIKSGLQPAIGPLKNGSLFLRPSAQYFYLASTTNTDEVIMKEEISRAAQASKAVFNAGGEHYHFNMACSELGEGRVLALMQEEIMVRDRLPFEEAAVAAAYEFKTIKSLESGHERFKLMRARAKETTQASARSQAMGQLDYSWVPF